MLKGEKQNSCSIFEFQVNLSKLLFLIFVDATNNCWIQTISYSEITYRNLLWDKSNKKGYLHKFVLICFNSVLINKLVSEPASMTSSDDETVETLILILVLMESMLIMCIPMLSLLQLWILKNKEVQNLF